MAMRLTPVRPALRLAFIALLIRKINRDSTLAHEYKLLRTRSKAH
jgi:hypothetical protein